MEGLPGWAHRRGHLRDNTNIKEDTHHSLTHSNKAVMRRLIMMAKWYSGNHVSLKLPDICLIGEEKSRKTSPRKLVPTGDWTRARCETGALATARSTTVDEERHEMSKWENEMVWRGGIKNEEYWWDKIEEMREPREKHKKSRHRPLQLSLWQYRNSNSESQ